MKKLLSLIVALALLTTTAFPAGLKQSDAPNLSGGMTTATAAAGAVTVNSQLAVITTEALVTAAGADYTLTVTNNRINAGAAVFVTVGNGTNTIAPAYAHSVAVSEGSVVIKVRNANAGALNGTLTITILVL
jgi:hypothetical protein